MSPRPRLFLLGAACAALLLLSARPAPAQGLAKLDCSIKEIPADAAYYTAWMRNREQYEAVVNSKAWAKIVGLDQLQQGWQIAQLLLAQPGGPFDTFQKWYQLPESKELVRLLGDMASHEVFLYGGAGWPEFVDLMGEVQGSRYGAQISRAIQAAQRGPLGQNQNEQAIQLLVESLAENPNRIVIPEIVIGFKVSDAKAAAAQLKKMEKQLQEVIDQVPELKGKLKRGPLAGGDFLTLTIDGKLVPWEQIPIQQFETKAGQADKITKKLQSLQLNIAFGVRGQYVLLALGPSTSHLAKLGQGKKLVDLPELEPLAKHSDKKLTSISYVSQTMAAKAGASEKDIDDLLGGLTELLKLGGAKPKQINQMKKDLVDIAKDLKAQLPKPGATLSISFLTAKGFESYGYDYGQYPGTDGSKPLTVLNHVGGSPLLFLAGRSRMSPDDWTIVVKIAKAGVKVAEEFILPQMDVADRAKYQKFMKAVTPLLVRFDDAVGKQLVPALADGQAALVLDAKLTSKQWHKDLPAAPSALPLLEPALVFGVSDSAQLQKAGGELRAIFNELYAVIRKELPKGDELPEFQIPAPAVDKLKAGAGYSWPLPAQAGLDKRLLIQAALSDKFLTLTMSKDHAERLLTATPLKGVGTPLADVKKPLAGAAYLDWAGLMDAAWQWVEFGYRWRQLEVNVQAKDDEVLKTLRVVFDVLKCFRSATSATYLEGKATVTHSESVFQDVK